MNYWYGDNPNCGRCGNLNGHGACSLTACAYPTIFESSTLVVKPKTNADRVRAMSDEELTRLLNDIQVAAFLYGKCRTETLKYPSTPNEWYSWLKQEAVERAEEGEKRHDVGIVPYEEDGRAAEHGDSYGENRNDQDADIGEHIKCAEDFCEIRWSDED